MAEYAFRVIRHKDMTEESMIPWLATLELMDKVVRERSIKLKSIRLHYHPNGMRTDHAMGVADFDKKQIVLCASDFDTALHELAHIWTDDAHTTKWARALYRLYDWYIPEQAAELKKTTSREYRNARLKIKKENRAWKTSRLRTCSLDG
jgi:hypothetical protein